MKNIFKYSKKNNQISLFLLTIFFVFTAIMIMYARSGFINGDTPWHISVGNWILENKKIPIKDIFSQFTIIDGKDLFFIAHEWLFDVILAFLHKVGKLNLVYLFSIITVFCGYLFSVFKSNGNKLLASIVFFILVLVGFNKDIYIIPDTLATIILIINNYILVKYIKENNSKKLKNLLISNCLLVILLANVHGGMLIANLLQQIIILLCNIIFNKKIKESVIILSCTLFTSLLNPRGWIVYSYSKMLHNEAAKYLIDYEPFYFNNVKQIAVVGILFLLIISGIFIKLKVEKNKNNVYIDIILLCMFFGMLLRYQRTLNIFLFALLLYSVRYIEESLKSLKNTYFKINLKKKFNGFKIFVFLILIVLNIIIIPNKIEKNQTINEYCNKNYISKAMIEYIQEEKAKNENYKIFNSLELGGFLISYNINPYIDGRIDCYSKSYGEQSIIEEYMKSIHSIDLLNKVTRRENIDCLILKKNSLSTQIVYASNLWELKEESNEVALFVRIK